MNCRAAALGLLLAACARAPVIVQPELTLPPRPILRVCTEAHVVGRTSEGSVTFDRQMLDAYRKAVAEERACRKRGAILLEGHLEKLENRLRALGAR